MTLTTSCAGWPIGTTSELPHSLSDGDQTIKTMMGYVWMGSFCSVPSLSVPAGYVVSEGQVGAGSVAGTETLAKTPVGPMATSEWASEDVLLRSGFDAKAVGASWLCRPPGWVDAVELARQDSSKVSE